MKKIAVLGSTGSIGVNTLRVMEGLPRKDFRVTALAANSNVKLLAEQVRKFRPASVCVSDPDKMKELKRLVTLKGVSFYAGGGGLNRIAASKDVDLVVMAILGRASLMPLIAAVEAGKTIALASKEPLVTAGRIIMRKARDGGAEIIPVDSEHSAIFQCLAGAKRSELKKIYLTGTGGPLRKVPKRDFNKLSPSAVARHPKWKMGKKISVDSATLMNKGLEVIEAMRLFGTAADEIEVLIHPEAIVHSMVELTDGAIMAQMAIPDMRLPIQYALTFPERMNGNILNLDTRKLSTLTFHQPDRKKFPCLELAYEAAKRDGTFPAVLNAANEEAVCGYLAGKLKFTAIPGVVERVMRIHRPVQNPKLADILNADNWAREEARHLI